MRFSLDQMKILISFPRIIEKRSGKLNNQYWVVWYAGNREVQAALRSTATIGRPVYLTP
jgi:hypothetical protein